MADRTDPVAKQGGSGGDRDTERLDAVWRALSDPTRRGLLDELRERPKTTGELCAAFPELSRFGVMTHLGVLGDAGLIVVRREGRQRWNHLNAVPLREIYERWVSRYEDHWAGSMLRLRTIAERAERAANDTTSDGADGAGANTREHAMTTKILPEPARVAVVNTEIRIGASPATVYRAWFDSTHDWFYENEEGKADRPARIEEKLGGRFYMDLGDRGFNVLAEVTMIKKNEKIRLRGDCTMPNAFIANMTVAFEKDGDGTRVTVEHRMSGEFPDDLPGEFEEGWLDGLTKLKALCERAG